MNESASNCDRPELVNLVCSFHGTPTQIGVLLHSILVSILGTFIFISNSLTLAFYIKFKNDCWNFLSFCTIELMAYNILLSLQCFTTAISDCFTYLNTNTICLAKYCLSYFTLLMIFKVNFCMSLGRLYQVRIGNIIILDTFLLRTSVFIAPPLISLFAFAPLFIHESICDCFLVTSMPGWYIISFNCICLSLALLTSVTYFAIYRFVRCSVKSSSARSQCDLSHTGSCEFDATSQRYSIRESIHQRLTNLRKKSQWSARNDKIQVLRLQTFLFFMMFVSMLPFFLLTTYEVASGVKKYGLISKIRVYFAMMILVDGVFKPLLFTYRLEFMKKGYAKLFRMKQTSPVADDINNNVNVNTLEGDNEVTN